MGFLDNLVVQLVIPNYRFKMVYNEYVTQWRRTFR